MEGRCGCITVDGALVCPAAPNPNCVAVGNCQRSIYTDMCHLLGCTVECIGKTGRTFGDRHKEYLRAPSLIYDHGNTTGHSIQPDNFSIMNSKSQGAIRTIKEAMFIRVSDPPEPWQLPTAAQLE